MNICDDMWTVAHLASLSDHALDQVARQAARSLALSKLQAGRVMLAMEQTGLPKRLGYKNALHYFKLAGARYVEARECKRVARGCEQLPILRAAAETGRIGWTNLREVVRVANPETERDWLDKCKLHTSKEVQKMVKSTKAAGQAPPVPGRQSPEDGPVELRLKLSAGMDRLLDRATRELSERAGRPLGVREVVECLLAHYLTGHPFPGEMRWRRMLGEPDAEEKNSREFIWGAVAATEEPCPGEPELEIVRPAPAHWDPPSEARRLEAFGCACPDCPDRMWLEVHELVSHLVDGVTVPDNLLVLCAGCRRRVHSGKLRVETVAGGGLRWLDAARRDLMELAAESLDDPVDYDDEDPPFWASGSHSGAAGLAVSALVGSAA